MHCCSPAPRAARPAALLSRSCSPACPIVCPGAVQCVPSCVLLHPRVSWQGVHHVSQSSSVLQGLKYRKPHVRTMVRVLCQPQEVETAQHISVILAHVRVTVGVALSPCKGCWSVGTMSGSLISLSSPSNVLRSLLAPASLGPSLGPSLGLWERGASSGLWLIPLLCL